MYKDGNYTSNQLVSMKIERFVSEKEMKQFILDNIDNFCKDVLEVKLKKVTSEYKISDGQRKSKSFDLLIESECGKKIAIELKNPTFKSELQSAIGQCLVYLTASKISGMDIDRMVLISNMYDYLVPITIQEMKLPIDFIVMDNSKFIKLLKNE